MDQSYSKGRLFLPPTPTLFRRGPVDRINILPPSDSHLEREGGERERERMTPIFK